MKDEENEIKQKEAEEILKNEAEKKEKLKYRIQTRDNLKFMQIAQYKAIRDGDILQYELIDRRLISKPSAKGLALSSSSIEKIEKQKI